MQRISSRMFLLLFLVELAAAKSSAASCFLGGIAEVPAIFQFGDSLSDTGNSLIAFPEIQKYLNTPPYGETFFHRPTGRNSDGRLLIDFLASGYGLPLLDPYLLRTQGKDWRHGVNFATGGATALGLSFYDEHNISVIGASRQTFPFDVQLQWFREFKNISVSNQGGTYPSPDDFSQALYVVGEIGGNDYANMRRSGMDYSQIMQLVHYVVGAIRNLIQSLYNLGARKFLLINIPRQGCNPGILLMRRPNDRLDALGCIAEFNNVNSHHNALLRVTVDDLHSSIPDAIVAHADFYGLMGAVRRNPEEHGFTEAHTACCGSPLGNSIVDCVEGGQTCSDPSTHIYWNGVHFTDHFNNVAATAFLAGQYVELVTSKNLTGMKR